MSSIPNLSTGPSSALFPTNIHAHGHKRGSQVDAGGDSASDASQASGAVENLFGSLLQSIEQVVGLQPATATSAAASAAAGTPATAATNATTAATAASTSGAGASSIHTANTLVQNYLNNLSLKQQASMSQLTKPAGSTVNTDA